MSRSRILNEREALLIVVDAQEAFRSAIGDFALAVANISRVVRGFALLDLPVVVTEQYPDGLGKTVEEIALALPDGAETIEKTSFGATGSAKFGELLERYERRQIVLCGFEAHVCVLQTAIGLIESGRSVHILNDAVASRYEHDLRAAMKKMFDAGAISSSVEIALFELIKDSRHEKFKSVHELIR